MYIRSFFILMLVFCSGIIYSLACSIPPDIIHEFRLDTSGPTIHIRYTLMGWKNLHPKILDEIQKNTGFDTVEKNFETVAREFLLVGSQLRYNQQEISLKYMTGRILEYPPLDFDTSYNPVPLIEIEFATNIPYPLTDSTEIRLIFDKTHLYGVSPLIHAYIYSDIQQHGQSDNSILGGDNRSYFPSSLSGQTYGFRNTLDETNTINTFVLYIEPMQDGRLSKDASMMASIPLSSKPYQANIIGSNTSTIKGYLEPYIRGTGGLYIQVFGLIIALLAGMIHGLLPGHSKTLIGTYMISSKKTNYRDILILIGSVTFSHTIFIFILAAIIITLEKGIGAVTTYVVMISALCYIVFGVYFYIKGTRALRHIDHSSSLFITKDIQKKDCECTPLTQNISLKGTTLSGILAGANPCIDALALFIFAVSIGTAGYAFLMIVFFSLGLGLMLGILALVVSRSRVLLEKRSQQFAERISAHITILAGIAIIVMGLYTIFR